MCWQRISRMSCRTTSKFSGSRTSSPFGVSRGRSTLYGAELVAEQVGQVANRRACSPVVHGPPRLDRVVWRISRLPYVLLRRWDDDGQLVLPGESSVRNDHDRVKRIPHCRNDTGPLIPKEFGFTAHLVPERRLQVRPPYLAWSSQQTRVIPGGDLTWQRIQIALSEAVGLSAAFEPTQALSLVVECVRLLQRGRTPAPRPAE